MVSVLKSRHSFLLLSRDAGYPCDLIPIEADMEAFIKHEMILKYKLGQSWVPFSR